LSLVKNTAGEKDPSSHHCVLLSVSNKTGVVEIALAFHNAGYTLLSTGGTAALLREADLPVTDVAEHTGAAEMMAGRVKTLHPTVHGGILGRRGIDDQIMLERNIAPIDFVIVNLYPFAETVAKEEVTFDEAIENIDIGGPAMVRAAAKNHDSVMVVTDPADYSRVSQSLDAPDSEREQLRFDLAVKAFEHTAHYDGMIANYFGRVKRAGTVSDLEPFSKTVNLQYDLAGVLRYGENPHQQAAFYHAKHPARGSLAASSLLQGKPLSYNNVMDADAALACVQQFEQPCCVIVKHANPCGVCVAADLLSAYDRAFHTDETSAFGGIIAFNRALDRDTAKSITDRQFVEVIIAPGMDEGVADVLAGYPNVRLLDCQSIAAPEQGWQLKQVSGGMLVQDNDSHTLLASDVKVVSKRQPEEHELKDLLFAWNVAKFVKSNAIVYCRDMATVGVGAGQMSRVYSAKIAAIKAADAGLAVTGAAMASDAFFPFRDGIDQAAEAGISSVIQPGGSRNDAEVIEAANEHNMAMLFTGIRHFRH